ncbi:MAG: helix-turn-helix transcriptional regulator [Bdellovibrionota bacterium]
MNITADRLRSAREHAGLSQGQVAKMLDMHRPTISEIEAGRRKVSTEELTEFAKLYDVSVAWLTGTEATEQNLNDKVLLAARDLTKLKKDDLEKVLKLLESMRGSS